MRKAFTRDELLQLFDYLPTFGVLIWKRPSKYYKRLVGHIAGSPAPCRLKSKQYWSIQIDGVKYKRSRLVFCVATGRWPEHQIDHIDGNSLNDCASNLREATVTQNAWNHHKRAKASGLPMGVRSIRSGTHFQARIGVNKKLLSLGVFMTAAEASEAYVAARIFHFGEFA